MHSSPSRYFMYSPYLYPLFTEPVIPYFLVLKVIRSVNFSILSSHGGQTHTISCCHLDCWNYRGGNILTELATKQIYKIKTLLELMYLSLCVIETFNLKMLNDNCELWK
jgi:hypothetical protein